MSSYCYIHSLLLVKSAWEHCRPSRLLAYFHLRIVIEWVFPKLLQKIGTPLNSQYSGSFISVDLLLKLQQQDSIFPCDFHGLWFHLFSLAANCTSTWVISWISFHQHWQYMHPSRAKVKIQLKSMLLRTCFHCWALWAVLSSLRYYLISSLHIYLLLFNLLNAASWLSSNSCWISDKVMKVLGAFKIDWIALAIRDVIVLSFNRLHTYLLTFHIFIFSVEDIQFRMGTDNLYVSPISLASSGYFLSKHFKVLFSS